MKCEVRTLFGAIISVTIVLHFACNTTAFGQSTLQPGAMKIAPRPCEFNNMALELASQDAGKDSVLILIARPGLIDRRKRTQDRRLHTARAYLVEYTKLSEAKGIVTAKAPRDGRLFYGGIEIYVKGKLQDVLTFEKDSDLSVGTCSGEQPIDHRSRARLAILYPWIYGESK